MVRNEAQRRSPYDDPTGGKGPWNDPTQRDTMPLPIIRPDHFEGITQAKKPLVAIVGGGVIGLVNAVLAQEAGYRAVIYADKSIEDTTTWRAAASFVPFGVPLTPEVMEMAQEGWGRFHDLEQRGTPETGVRRHTHIEASDYEKDTATMPYLDIMEDVREIHGHPELVPGRFNHAISYTTFFMEIPIYIPWLIEKFKQGGGLFVARHFDNLQEIAQLDGDVVFNCTGIGARRLTGDETLVPLLGQVSLIGPQQKMIDGNYSINWNDTMYVYPQPLTEGTIIGGTLTVDPRDTAALDEGVDLSR